MEAEPEKGEDTEKGWWWWGKKKKSLNRSIKLTNGAEI
jgi:hypothetical protein